MTSETPDTPTVCPACGNDRSHDWWPVGDDSYGCDLSETPDTPSTARSADDIRKEKAAFARARLPDTPSTEVPTRYSLEPYATDALRPDPDGEWVQYAERATRQEAADPSGL